MKSDLQFVLGPLEKPETPNKQDRQALYTEDDFASWLVPDTVADTFEQKPIMFSEQTSKLMSLENVGIKYERREGRWKFSQFWAIQDVSFDIHKGECVGIIGRNGAGKSTLLRLLAGIYKADRGEVTKHQPFTSSLLALNVGFVNHLSGRENVVLGAMLLGLTKARAKEIVEEVKLFSGLGDFFEQPILTYSTGMKARLGFSVAHHANPDMILIDETLGVGDKDFVGKSTKALEAKIKNKATTVVLVSHAVPTHRKLCDKVIWIENGVVFKQGDAAEVLDAYVASKPK